MKTLPLVSRRGPILIVGVFLNALALAGCGLISHSEHHRSSSVVSFLFPDEVPHLQEPGLPVLQLPLRVGIAFVPEEKGRVGYDRFSETRKQAMLQTIAAEFRSLPFVQSIQTIPELYLRRGGGFQNLDQLRGLLGIDVVVLLSYDQAQFSTENKRAIAYWTIVGAYLVKGNRNDTHTLMEATVYDIPSRTLLFHAPGVDLARASSTLAYAEIDRRKDSEESFVRATNDLTANLQAELTTFQEAVKTGTATVAIEHRAGYSGGGALDAFTVVAGLLVLLAGGWSLRPVARKGDHLEAREA